MPKLKLYLTTFLDKAEPKLFEMTLELVSRPTWDIDETDEEALRKELARLWNTGLFGVEHPPVRLDAMAEVDDEGSETVIFGSPPEPRAAATSHLSDAEAEAVQAMVMHVKQGIQRRLESDDYDES
jgi:hypothetical protein